MGVTITGGDKARRLVDRALKADSVPSIDIGWFSSAKYDTGVPIAAVAAWNEFGTIHIPERPFIRNSIRKYKQPILENLAARIDPETLEVTKHLAESVVGEGFKTGLQTEIRELSTPPNAPSTIRWKTRGTRSGPTTPLIDNGDMRKSITYRVND